MRDMEIVRRHRQRVPVDVIGLIKDLGISYHEELMHPDNSGRINRAGWGWAIAVNEDESEQRKRFTAAHELGHYLMHRDLIEEHGHLDCLFGPASAHNPHEPLAPRHEMQANSFAVELLMPADEIRRRYDAGLDNVSELARTFIVSPQAMKVRLDSLRLRPKAMRERSRGD